MNFKIKNLLVILTVIFLFSNCSKYSRNNEYNILDFGAVNDSTILSTKAIQNAINTASKNGGGKIIFPQGVYLTGTIVLQNNVSLFLTEGSRIKGSEKHEDYLYHRTKINIYPDPDRANLIYGDNLKNISIEGKGVIDGNGTKF